MNNWYSNPTIVNCTFLDNSTNQDGGAVAVTHESTVTVINSILWDNAPDEVYVEGDSSCSVSYSDCLGGCLGAGNIESDPLFVDAAAGDLQLQTGSPCIDAADGAFAPELDIEGYGRVDDPLTSNTGTGTPAYADMGAYEYQAPEPDAGPDASPDGGKQP